VFTEHREHPEYPPLIFMSHISAFAVFANKPFKSAVSHFLFYLPNQFLKFRTENIYWF